MRTWLKRGLLVSVVFISIWILVVLYWHNTKRMPDAADIVLYFLVLPIVFLLLVWGVRKIGLFVATLAAAKPAVTAPTLETGAMPALATSDAHHRTLAIVASAVRAAHGNDPASLHEALSGQDAKLELDPELTDANGFPVRTGRIPDVDTSATEIALRAWEARNKLPTMDWQDEHLRALTLATDVLTDALNDVLRHPLLASYQSASDSGRQAIKLPSLEIVFSLPAWWTPDQRERALTWLATSIQQNGWPAEKTILSPLNSAQLPNVLGLVDRLALQSHRQNLPCFALLIACESFIGEYSIAEWERGGRLLTGARNAGQIPAEGAVALLVTDVEQAQLLASDTAASVHQIFQGQRDKPVDARGRIGAELLATQARQALETSELQASDINLIVSDSDHRASRVEELMAMAHEVFPDMELSTQCLKVAEACGTAEYVSSLTALALAHHAAVSEQAPVLCVTNQDSLERAVLIVSPFKASVTV